MMNRVQKTSVLSALLIAAAVQLTACSSSGGGGATPAQPPTAAPAGNPPAAAPVSVFTNAIMTHGLPSLSDQTAPSVDRVLIDKLVAQADQLNKTVVLEVAAAWCGPCTQFAQEMDNHPEYFKALADSGNLFVKAEYEKTAEGSIFDLNDFTPYLPHFFPSFFVYQTGQGWRAIGSFNTYAQLSAGLTKIKNLTPFTPVEMAAYLDKLGQAASADPTVDPDGIRFSASVYGLSTSYSYGDARAILKVLRDVDKKYPKLNAGSYADEVQMLFLPDFVVSGAIDVKNLAIDFPADAAHLIDVSQDSFSNVLFVSKLVNFKREAGLKAAAAECDSMWKSVRAQLVPGTKSAADFQTQLATMDHSALVICTDLLARSEGASDAVKQRASSIDLTSTTDWNLVAILGDAAKATAIYHKQFTGYMNDYNQSLTDETTQLATATTANDAAKIKELNDEITLRKFQIQNHTNVDTEVEAELTAGQPVPVLKLMN